MKKKPKRPRKKRNDEVTDELRAIYEAAKKDGIWILEFGGATHMTAAGPVSKIEEIEKRNGREIDIAKEISLGDILMGGLASPGEGETREEACRNAVAACKKDFKMR